MSGEEEGAESFTLDALTPTLSNTSSGGEDHGGDEDEEEEDADLEDTESGGGKHGERKQHAGGMAQRLGYLVLRGPREIEGTPYVHIYSLAEWQDTDFWRALVAEALATCFAVWLSILIILSSGQALASSPAGQYAWIIVCHVVLMLTLIYIFAPLSGAYFNPAIAITVVFCRRITIVRGCFYVIAQLVGAVVGAGLVKLALPSERQGDLTVSHLPPNTSAGQVCLMEMMMTFGQVFASFGTAFDPRGWGRLGPVAIALIFGLNIHAGAISSSWMNPARAFGPAVVEWSWDDHWVWWVGPIVGGVVAGVTYEYLFMQRKHGRPRGVPSTSGDNHRHKKKRKIK